MPGSRKTRSRHFAGFLVLAAVAAVPALLLADDGPAPSEPDKIIAFLNQTIVWYRHVAAEQQLVNGPTDAITFNENRQLADQVARQSFDYARARARALSKTNKATPANANLDQAAPQSQSHGLIDRVAKTDEQAKQTQDELAGLKKQAEAASGQKRQVLDARIAEVQAELDLLQARQDSLHNMLDFANTTANTSAVEAGLPSQIEALARALPGTVTGPPPTTGTRAVPAAAAPAASPASAAAPVTVVASAQQNQSTGLYALLSDVLGTRKKLQTLENALAITDALEQAGNDLRDPLVAHARDLTKSGDDLAAQPDSMDPVVLAQQRKTLDDLTAQFKQSSAALLPLSKQAVLLNLYKRNISNWQGSLELQYSSQEKSLLWRLGVLALTLVIVFVLSDVWRRVTFRYVQDAHRRQQFLLLRRIAVVFVVLIIVIVAFASGIGPVTTFAGLLTAGVAVSLQNVILAVAGYFFLVGKYGVRVGDRIQVAGVTGEVMDIGLIRLHMMEISGSPVPRPTGRVVAFSNAAVFQPDGIFKQIPGTNFLWHEVALTLPPGSDYTRVEKIMVETVSKIFAGYREKIEGQRKSMERALSTVNVESFDPESRLRLTQEGVQVIVRYAVDLTNAAEIDDRVIREVLQATGHEPQIQPANSSQQSALSNQPKR
ncbi:MAG TPA: mechanosensitive ion channel domain-containing protein [Candidatus Angelobacter sp.]|nr:mechanosensitive ion channel domain-containing protein [Candidatus Angelobacter sp.]